MIVSGPGQNFSASWKLRNRLKSISTTPGLRMVFRPTFPKRTSVIGANAVVSNQWSMVRSPRPKVPFLMRLARWRGLI